LPLSRRIRVTATHRDPIDLDRLATALLAIVGDLDEATRAELAAEGQQLLEELDAQKRPAGRKGAA
jgi:hypothetical protein